MHNIACLYEKRIETQGNLYNIDVTVYIHEQKGWLVITENKDQLKLMLGLINVILDEPVNSANGK